MAEYRSTKASQASAGRSRVAPNRSISKGSEGTEEFKRGQSGQRMSVTSVALQDVLSKVKIDEDSGKRREAAVERFLQGDTLDGLQKKEIAQDREKARAEMEAAVAKREDKVNPVLVELLKKHYGVDFDSSGKGVAKVGATKKTKRDYNEDIQRLYEWAQTHEEKRRELAELHEQNMQETCPFAPNLSNKSRQIYANEKEKIMQKREKRQKELEERRLQKAKEEKAKFRNLDANKDAFSRRIVKKTEKKEENHDRNEDQRENAQNVRGDKLTEGVGTKHKKTRTHGGDNFHKQMMEWCDKRDKNKTQKTVEHWVNTFETMENTKSSKTPKRRTKAEQIAHADIMIGTLEKKAMALERQRESQVRGFFQPKVSQYIPKREGRSKSKENYESLNGQSLNVIYYTRGPTSPGKDTAISASKFDKSASKSPYKSYKASAGRSSVNLVEVEEQKRDEYSRTLISARE